MWRHKKGMPEKCLETTSLMKELGFMINVEKSVLVPQKQITFLGNIIDSDQMIVILPTEKQEIIVNECKKLFKRDKDTIRNVAKVIGLIVSTFSAVQYGKLHYRQLEQGKILALKRFKGNYDTYMTITLEMKEELAWWFTNIYIQKRDISHGVPEKILNTDASLQGWGAVMLSEKIGGRWTQSESLKHINYLEILAIYYALQAFHDLVKNTHIKILTDNSTAVSYINNMGGVKSDDCNLISKKIWIWCIKHNIWISCSHIAGKKNIEADKKSRIFNDDLEWQLNLNFFQNIVEKWGKPDIDMFASRLNNQVKAYCSWKPDPYSVFVDAFTVDWKQFKLIYMFPPFSLLGSCIQKIRLEEANAVVVAPLWPTQPWFTRLMEMLVDQPILIRRKKDMIFMPHKAATHSLQKTLKLMICRVSGKDIENKAFLEKQLVYLWHHGDHLLKNNTSLSLKDGFSTVIKGKLVFFNQI